MKLIVFIAILLSGCTNYTQYPIVTSRQGIVEIIHVNSTEADNYEIALRIRTAVELYDADFSSTLKTELEKKATSLCLNGIKDVESDYQKIYTLGEVSRKNTVIRHRLDAKVECL